MTIPVETYDPNWRAKALTDGKESAAQLMALGRLAEWSSQSRDELVHGCWMTGERNIAKLARTAGVHPHTIRADLAKHGVDVPADRAAPAQPGPSVQPVQQDGYERVDRPWHYAAYVGEKKLWGGMISYSFRGITGREARPKLPDSVNALPYEQRKPMMEECRAAEQLWQRERLVTIISCRSRDLQRRWSELMEAWTALQAAYKNVTAGSGSWVAAVATLVEAQEAAIKAADHWDDGYEDLQRDMNSEYPGYEAQGDALAEFGERHQVNVKEWCNVPGLPSEVSEEHRPPYTGDSYQDSYITPEMRTYVDRQNERVAKIGSLSGA